MKKSFFNKTILGNFVFINEENKSKEIQGKNVLSFTKFVLGVLAWGVLSGVFCPDATHGIPHCTRVIPQCTAQTLYRVCILEDH